MSNPSTANLLAENGDENPREYRERLLTRLSAVEDERRALRTRFNQTSPIAKVPPEIVTEIMGIVASSVDDFSWMRTTHIFGAWRQIALRCSTLWADLSFEHPDLTREMLARSGTAPLSIKFKSNESSLPFTSVLQSALCETGRLREIELHANQENLLNLKSIFVGTTGPLKTLETLSLRVGLGHQAWPLHAASFEASSIRRLDVQCLFIPSWTVLPLSPSLTHLRLHANLYGPDHSRLPDAAQLVEALQKLPNLRSLELGECLSQEIATLVNTPIELPALESLTLHGRADEIASFLSAFKIHDSTSVDINCNPVNDDGNQGLTEMFTALKRSWPIAQSGVRKLHIRDFRFTEDANEHVMLISFAGDHPHPHNLRLAIEDEPESDDWDDLSFGLPVLMRFFKEHFNLAPLTVLEVKVKNLDGGIWRTFSQQPALREITLGCYDHAGAGVPSYLANFARSLRSSGSNALPSLPYPSLKHVNVVTAQDFARIFIVATAELTTAMIDRPASGTFSISLKQIPNDTPVDSCWAEL